MTSNAHRTSDALLEIGSEELPASFIPIGMKQLKTLAEESLKVSGLHFTSTHVYGTPRRLAIVIHGIAERSEDQKKMAIGPPASIAKDAEGHWTQAALGFARKQGVKPSDLVLKEDRIVAHIHIKGVPAKQLLGDLFSQWIDKLEFPKSMRWEPAEFQYPRPIRWIAALYGSDLVSVHVADVRSARWTLGLGPYTPKKIPIPNASKYVMLLKNQCVLVEPEARREAIQRFADHAVKRVHGKVHHSPALLEQVVNLVEHPVAILGNFDPAYLDLPKEVLITCLEHHQKFFPVETTSGGKLLPHFVGIRNGMSMHQEIVREGYERVLAARLADARFFYNQDRQHKLESRVGSLKGVIFQQQLGTLHDKIQRVERLVVEIAGQLPASAAGWIAYAPTIVQLCKTDLTTAMVGEFPELQGVVARLYAEAEGLPNEVSSALEEHYWPITLTSKLPNSDAAAAVSLADKLDTLVGDFAINIMPKGSADPYGLRRAAVGVIRILENRKWPIGLEALIDKALQLYPANIANGRPTTAKDLCQFMKQRYAALLEERGYKFDEIEAVLSGGVGNVSDALSRLEALHQIRKRKEFEPLAVVFKRADNIIRKSGLNGPAQGVTENGQIVVIVERFKDDSERVLYTAIQESQEDIRRFLQHQQYNEALERMVRLREPLDQFFTKVMVNDENIEVRANRYSMLQILTDLFRRIADFSKLQNA